MHGYAIKSGRLALINAGLAQSKNISALNRFVISLLIGPVATLVLVLFAKDCDLRVRSTSLS